MKFRLTNFFLPSSRHEFTKTKFFATFIIVFSLFIVLSWIPGAESAQNKYSRRQSESCGRIDLIAKDIRTATPWHVAIFRRVSPDNWEFFTGGTIFAPGLVFGIQAGPAGAFPSDKNPKNFFIAAGVNSTDLQAVDKYSQFSRVTLVQSMRDEWDTNIYYHDVVYHLETPLNIQTPYVREICLPLFLANPNTRLPTNLPYLDYTFVLVGFTRPKPNEDSATIRKLRALRVGSIQPNVCASLFRYYYKRELPIWCLARGQDKKSRDYSYTKIVDELKAASVEKLSPEEEDQLCLSHGSQSTLALGNFWYSGIIISVIPGNKRGKCNRNTVYGGAISDAGVISKYLTWLNNQYKCGEKMFSCGDSRCIPLSLVCNGNRECADGADEYYGDCSKLQLTREGDKRGKLAGNSVTGLSGDKRGFTCPPLKFGEGVSCFNTGTLKRVDCNLPKYAGTRLRVECDEFHYAPKYSYSHLDISCSNDGSWENMRMFYCQKECGRHGVIRNEPGEELYPGFPWEVAIFNGGNHACGGALIEQNFILTHPRCIKPWLESLELRIDFELLIRPVNQEYSKNFEIGGVTQSFRLKKVWLPDGGRNFDEGIALVQFDGVVEVNAKNKPGPVCYLEAHLKPPRAGLRGLVTKWSEQKLDSHNVTIVAKQECGQGQRRLGENQFCTKLKLDKPNSGVTKHELKLGAGLIVQQKVASTGQSAYTIKGILNEIQSDHLVFSQVGPFFDWMADILESES